MTTLTYVVIGFFIVTVICGIFCINDIAYNFTGAIFQTGVCIFLVLFGIWIILLSNKGSLKKNGPDYTELDNYIFEVKSTISYGESSYIAKDNTYYSQLIDRVKNYNEAIDKLYSDYNFYNLEIPERFLTYQKMVYNYNDNSITWENGISIMIEVKEV